MLNAILILFFLVMVRLWHVAVTQHEEKIAEAERPQRRVVVERAERAPIYDRFGVPLALNKAQYNASISYARIREVPRFVWKKQGRKRVKIFRRKEYITELATLLAKELNLDAESLEDLIHAKASVFGSVPFLVKENISEEKYFKLKMLEKDWPGLVGEVVAKRCYPLGRVGSSVVGYMGAISQKHYRAITTEMKSLRERLHAWEEGSSTDPHPFFSIDVSKKRLSDLEAKAYSITDFVGKTGVEAFFDENLKGWQGKRTYLSDIKGRYLKELPGGVDSKGGERITLTLSAELQEYAERLLIEYESEEAPKKDLYPELHPWIKGGAIVVLDPNSGEVYALASSPRFDPNDFIKGGDAEEKIKKQQGILRWLENERYLGQIWDGVVPLKRERFDLAQASYIDEELKLSWENYLKCLFPKDSPIQKELNLINTIDLAARHQLLVRKLFSCFLTEEELCYPYTAKVLDFLYPANPTNTLLTLQDKERFEGCLTEEVGDLQGALSLLYSSLSSNVDKLLVADLCRLALDPSLFSKGLLPLVGAQSISDFRRAESSMGLVRKEVEKICRKLHREHDFKKWRESEFKSYLAKKREEEKKNKRYAKPYTDYLSQEEKRQFQVFWEQGQYQLLATLLTEERGFCSSSYHVYEKALLIWAHEMNQGGHRALPWVEAYHALKKITDEFHPSLLIGYLKTLRGFKDLNAPLWGCYIGVRSEEGVQKQKHLATAFYPKYGYGPTRPCAYAQATRIGSIFKLVPSYAVVTQRYQSGQHNLNPLTIVDDKRRVYGKRSGGWHVGFWQDGRPIPMLYRGGRLPRSDHSGIGRVDLKRALETSSNPYFSIVAAEMLNDPEDLCDAARVFGFGAKTGISLPGEYSGYIPKDVSYNKTGLYSMAIGQHSLIVTPLQTAVMLAAIANGGSVLKPKLNLCAPTEVQSTVPLPKVVRSELIQGMKQVVQGAKGTARILRTTSSLTPEQKALVPYVIGKTSTAEVGTRLSLDSSSTNLQARIIKDVGFGVIYFEDLAYTRPKLVVVIFLRRGDWGKKAAPLALKLLHKSLQLGVVGH